MKDSVTFLKNTISNHKDENKSLARWLEHGAWYDDIEAFLANWKEDDLGDDYKGLTDYQKAHKLAGELTRLYKRNRIQIFIARQLLEDIDNIPKRFEEPMMAWYHLEEMTDSVIKSMK